MNDAADEPSRPTSAEPELRTVSDEELGRILADHKKWVEAEDKTGLEHLRADLSRADLRGQAHILRVADLQKANLYRAQLQEANLDKTHVQGADLSGAQLQETTLRMAQLQGAMLPGAHLQKANLYRAQVQGALLADAQLQKANLSDAHLQRAVRRQNEWDR